VPVPDTLPLEEMDREYVPVTLEVEESEPDRVPVVHAEGVVVAV